MKAMLYMKSKNEPVAVFDDINVVKMNDNHTKSQYRVLYKSARLNSSKTMLELFRDEKMNLRLDDGRSCDVMLQHSSLDMEGNAVGVFRVLGNIDG